MLYFPPTIPQSEDFFPNPFKVDSSHPGPEGSALITEQL